MKTKALISAAIVAETLLSSSASKTVDPKANSTRLPVGKDKSIDIRIQFRSRIPSCEIL